MRFLTLVHTRGWLSSKVMDFRRKDDTSCIYFRDFAMQRGNATLAYLQASFYNHIEY